MPHFLKHPKLRSSRWRRWQRNEKDWFLKNLLQLLLLTVQQREIHTINTIKSAQMRFPAWSGHVWAGCVCGGALDAEKRANHLRHSTPAPSVSAHMSANRNLDPSTTIRDATRMRRSVERRERVVTEPSVPVDPCVCTPTLTICSLLCSLLIFFFSVGGAGRIVWRDELWYCHHRISVRTWARPPARTHAYFSFSGEVNAIKKQRELGWNIPVQNITAGPADSSWDNGAALLGKWVWFNLCSYRSACQTVRVFWRMRCVVLFGMKRLDLLKRRVKLEFVPLLICEFLSIWLMWSTLI